MRNKKFLFGMVVSVVAGMGMGAGSIVQAANSREASPAQQLQTHFVDVANRVGPAVVSISTEMTERVPVRRKHFGRPPLRGRDDTFDRFFRDFFGEMPEREFKQKGLGTGVIIDEEGYVLTNEHVVHGADRLTVTLPDGREFVGTIKGTDVRSDLAVIKIDATGLPAAQLGNSDDVQIGQWAIAIGNPFGWAVGGSEPTLTVGVISAINRSIRLGGASRDYSDLIQTDAAINPGNSGGPLVNLNGEVIGINVAIFSTTGGYQGIGFSIPVNTVKFILGDLIEGKRILYGWLGVSVQDVTLELQEHFKLRSQEGVIVARVLADSPAQEGGLKDGDVLVALNGKPLKNVREMLKKVARTKVGSQIKLTVIRDGRQERLSVKIGERPENLESWEARAEGVWRGLEVSRLTPELARRYRIRGREGVVVTHVEPGSSADRAGIRHGDFIFEINRRPVTSVDDFAKAASSIKGDALIKTGRGYAVLKAAD